MPNKMPRYIFHPVNITYLTGDRGCILFYSNGHSDITNGCNIHLVVTERDCVRTFGPIQLSNETESGKLDRPDVTLPIVSVDCDVVDGPEVEAANLATEQRNETKESGSVRLVCSMASVISCLVLVVCLCAGRIPGAAPEEGTAVVVVLREHCYMADINTTRLKELTLSELKEINSSWTVEFVPEKGN
ncbi:hypothetical protein J6590_007398 [Homalodisca vitripennis]|nr:hypothetical protein J6590_007398 [Homalodisca vitripennis]